MKKIKNKRFEIKPTEEGIGIWDNELEKFYSNNGKTYLYKSKAKAQRMLDICTKNWS